MFNRVLIANRGEIAVRIARSVKAVGGETIAVYSDVDRDALHVAACDTAVLLGGSSAAESYLDMDKILQAARSSGAQAIHPGYGFLSENAHFAKACADAGLIFIGPSPEAIDLMGNKRAAKIAVSKAGVPCIPGYEGADQSDAKMIAEAERIGFPIMVKAAAGGGGRGMRVVAGMDNLPEALESARTEARNAFGNDELILERAIRSGRHIEIQVAADAHGNVVHLGERDCSLQRRHQKVIEEAPSPFVDERLREAMGIAAVNAAKSCDYLGVGTVEFLVSEDRSFCFLEMNTRLQVEHPVTELVTGVDLVDWQLRIASGEQLPLTQIEISITGHAIEARVYAENPAANFMPQTGPIFDWRPPTGEGVRVDCGIKAPGEVSPYYDPMIAKIIAYGASREQARQRLVRALGDTTLLGVGTNQAFLSQLLEDEVFVAGAATTSYIDEAILERARVAAEVSAEQVAVATVALMQIMYPQPPHFQNWSNAAPLPFFKTISVNEVEHSVTITAQSATYQLAVDDQSFEVITMPGDCVVSGVNKIGDFRYRINGVSRVLPWAFDGSCIYLSIGSRQVVAEDISYRPALSATAASSGQILATTEGMVVKVAVASGDRVQAGQLLVVVEAMKMEHRHLADGDGVVTDVMTSLENQVKKNQLLVSLQLDSPDGEGEA